MRAAGEVHRECRASSAARRLDRAAGRAVRSLDERRRPRKAEAAFLLRGGRPSVKRST